MQAACVLVSINYCMGTKRMGSQGDSGSRAVNNTIQDPRSQALTRQGSSLYNLTLDEVQNQLGDLGKPFSSMNLDELLKTVWNAEANQAANIGAMDYAAASAASGSLTPSLTRDLSKKTVDEVWQEIQQEQRNTVSLDRLNERQLTLGEITLEDFLVKAGAVAEACLGKGNALLPIGINETIQNIQHQQQQWMSYQVPPIHQQQQQQQSMIAVYMPGQPSQQTAANPMMDASYPESLMGTLSDTQTPGRKRGASGDVVVERTVERRQKRMIKNRESAARSRARKQAYTHELENKVSRLEEENEKLKKLKLENVLACVPLPEPKYQLRRTSSACF
ncbi:ABSCISIC ACID-INSENSITIVE 5-like protein 2 isoform X2 [Impatiens glandulifera]|uniref:ABSCISIC ACID-INSENSITIVE 5-like protein 2 isoform X2 n=1 Tax=Impatiens glandulifera TaxID=253017 RepID=UPI001FB058EB|nr:ABSCISIC ACID-INSENSITIVE 5-like protein 2 isoform X2 [Impatiens glandulifera]